jgi:type I restriction enzyme S subunit
MKSSFLKYRLNAADFVSFASHLNEGDRPRVSFDQIGKFRILVPPPAEQSRIVAKIEELFSELDKGVESLKTAQEQLRVYRQAVIKHAFEGKLTARWREQNGDKLENAGQFLARINQERKAYYQRQLEEWKEVVRDGKARGKLGEKLTRPKTFEPVEKPDASAVGNFPPLPGGWHWTPLSWLLSITKKPMTTGPFGIMLKKSEHQISGVAVLGIENIGEGKFIRGNKIFITGEKYRELTAFEVKAKEIIISRSGTVGEICEVPEDLGTALISTNLLRLSLNQNVILSPFFVFMFQGGGSVKRQVKDLCKGSSRDFLNQSILQSIMFPVCSPAEQVEVLNKIEENLSRIDKIGEEIDTNLIRIEALRQSILKRAFFGDLLLRGP